MGMEPYNLKPDVIFIEHGDDEPTLQFRWIGPAECPEWLLSMELDKSPNGKDALVNCDAISQMFDLIEVELMTKLENQTRVVRICSFPIF